jgi:hypothetical protein
MRNRMEREFEEGFKQFESSTPKDLIREYETPEGAKSARIWSICVWIFHDHWARW